MADLFNTNDYITINSAIGTSYSDNQALFNDLFTNADNVDYIVQRLLFIIDNLNLSQIIEKIVLNNSEVKTKNDLLSKMEDNERIDLRSTPSAQAAIDKFKELKNNKFFEISSKLEPKRIGSSNLEPSSYKLAMYKYLKYKQKYLQLVNISKGVNINHKLMY